MPPSAVATTNAMFLIMLIALDREARKQLGEGATPEERAVLVWVMLENAKDTDARTLDAAFLDTFNKIGIPRGIFVMKADV